MRKIFTTLMACTFAWCAMSADVVDTFVDDYGERTVPSQDINASTRL